MLDTAKEWVLVVFFWAQLALVIYFFAHVLHKINIQDTKFDEISELLSTQHKS